MFSFTFKYSLTAIVPEWVRMGANGNFRPQVRMAVKPYFKKTHQVFFPTKCNNVVVGGGSLTGRWGSLVQVPAASKWKLHIFLTGLPAFKPIILLERCCQSVLPMPRRVFPLESSPRVFRDDPPAGESSPRQGFRYPREGFPPLPPVPQARPLRRRLPHLPSSSPVPCVVAIG